MKPLSLFDHPAIRLLLLMMGISCSAFSAAGQESPPVEAKDPTPAPPPAATPVPAPSQPVPQVSTSAPHEPVVAPPPVVQAPAAPAAMPPPASAVVPSPATTIYSAPAPVQAPSHPPVRSSFPDPIPSEYQNVRIQLSGLQETQSIADPLNLQAKIANRTGDEITISQVRWELPRSIVATRPTESSREVGQTPWFQGAAIPQPIVLPYGGEQLVDLTMPDIHENWWTLPRNVRLMSFKPGEYPVKVRVEYAVGPYRRMSVAEETIRIRFDTTPWFYVWGGIIGSMVGVLFEFFYTAARRLDQFEWPRDDRGRIAPGYAIRDSIAFLFRWVLGGTAKWLTGSLTAAIVLLFLYYYKDVQLPITIQINDFFGAVVVGLVAHRLGLWVYETLFARGEKPRSGGKGGSGTEQFHFPQQVVPALTYTERR